MIIFFLNDPVIIRSLNTNFTEYVNTLDGELTIELKSSYLNNNLDKKQLFDLDEQLMNSIVKFYDNNVN